MSRIGNGRLKVTAQTGGVGYHVGDLFKRKRVGQKPKSPGFQLSPAKFADNITFDDVFQTFVGWDTVLRYLKQNEYRGEEYIVFIHSDSHDCDELRKPEQTTWKFRVFHLDGEKPLHTAYTNALPKIASHLMLRSGIWWGAGKPQYPLKNTPTLIIASNQHGRHVFHYEMDEFKDAVEEVKSIVASK